MDNKYTPDDYTVSVRRELVDGELLFVARVAEFSDVVMYGDTKEEVLSLVDESLKTLIAMHVQMHHDLPVPLSIQEQAQSYSGRVTLRMGKHLHRKIAQQADIEGVSLNQYIIERISEETGKCVVKYHVADMLTSFLRSNANMFATALSSVNQRGSIRPFSRTDENYINVDLVSKNGVNTTYGFKFLEHSF